MSKHGFGKHSLTTTALDWGSDFFFKAFLNLRVRDTGTPACNLALSESLAFIDKDLNKLKFQGRLPSLVIDSETFLDVEYPQSSNWDIGIAQNLSDFLAWSHTSAHPTSYTLEYLSTERERAGLCKFERECFREKYHCGQVCVGVQYRSAHTGHAPGFSIATM